MRTHIGLALLHGVGNALVLWLAYVWLGLGESDTGHLLMSIVLLLIVGGLAAWLHGTAFVLLSKGRGETLRTAAVQALRRLPQLLVFTILAVILYWLVALLQSSLTHAVFGIASYLTMTFRKPVSPASVQSIFNAMFWLLRWLILPAVLVPMSAHVAVNGWRGFRLPAEARRPIKWLQVFLLLLVAVWLPLRLLHWIPAMPNFWAEMISFLVRFAIAYLLFAGVLLVLEWRTAGGMPLVSQPNISPTP